MPVLSTFQNLPLHIAESIANYCISARNEQGNRSLRNKKQMDVWSTLYNVCYSWRLLSMKFYYRDLCMLISTKDGVVNQYLVNKPNDVSVDRTCYNYVKNVIIHVAELTGGLSCDTVRDFSSVWPEDLVLPSARILLIDLAVLSIQSSDTQENARNERFHWLSQRIQKSIPKLQTISINDKNMKRFHDIHLERNKWKADMFLSAVVGNAKKFMIETDTVHLASDLSFAKNGTGLTSLRCLFLQLDHRSNRLPTDYDTFSCLVEKSAPTLESMHYRGSCFAHMRALFLNDRSQPIIYSRLRNLNVSYYKAIPHSDKIIMDSTIVPFPVLRILVWNSEYMFKDNTIFRGNGNILEYLELAADNETVDIMEKCNVFGPGKFTQLRHVSTWCIYRVPDIPEIAGKFISFAIGIIAPETLSFSLSHEYLSHLFVAYAEGICFGNIQRLRLANFTGTVRQLLDILMLFPHVTKLVCSPVNEDVNLNIAIFNELADSLYAEYYPLSHCLRHWEVCTRTDATAYCIAYTALVFAILCPNFVLAFVPSEFVVHFGNIINNVTRFGSHDKQLHRIQRLLRILN